MERTLFKFLSVNILLGIMCSTAYAVPKNQKNVDTSTNIKKEIQQEIQQEMNSYYQKYKSQLIDFNNFDNVSKTK